MARQKLYGCTALLPEVKRAEGETQPLAVQGIVYFRETPDARSWLWSVS